MELLDGKKIASEIKIEIKKEVEEMIAAGNRPPNLVAILVGDDGASATYVRMKGNACRRVGMDSLKVELPKETTTEQLLAEIEKLKYDGFEGDVTSFLIPYATRGMKAKLLDNEHPNREGNYFIKKVVTTFGTGGARRKITIGNKL